MNPPIVIEGTLKPDGTLELDQKPNLPPGRVVVTMSVSSAATPPVKESVWLVLDRIWAERKALGMKGRTREEIDAEINEQREEWEVRMRELGRGLDESP